MNTKTNRILRVLQTNAPPKVIEIEVYYDKGGMNFFCGEVRPRGLYLSAQPVAVTGNKQLGICRETTAFSGTCICVKELQRFTKKQLLEYKADEEMIQKLITDVCRKSNLTLKA
jgi:hypothetical protein